MQFAQVSYFVYFTLLFTSRQFRLNLLSAHSCKYWINISGLPTHNIQKGNTDTRDKTYLNIVFLTQKYSN